MSEYEPITNELRETIRSLAIDDSVLTIGGDEFHRLCDAIDAVHAGLERENAELRQRVAELDKRGDSMHDGWSITDELREWMDRTTTRFDGRRYLLGTDEELTAIADRIDAEYQITEGEWMAKNGDMWLKGYSVCHEELMEGHPVIAADLEKAGWVKLPVDADGVPIRVGDVMDGTCPSGKHVNGTVSAIGDGVFWLSNVQFSLKPDYMHHYHAPTVEDVLRDFGVDIAHALDADPDATVPEATIAKYAAKLRLAGSDSE